MEVNSITCTNGMCTKHSASYGAGNCTVDDSGPQGKRVQVHYGWQMLCSCVRADHAADGSKECTFDPLQASGTRLSALRLADVVQGQTMQQMAAGTFDSLQASGTRLSALWLTDAV